MYAHTHTPPLPSRSEQQPPPPPPPLITVVVVLRSPNVFLACLSGRTDRQVNMATQVNGPFGSVLATRRDCETLVNSLG
nr:uncharacterized protein CTRU02_03876 [Colletotrichum truncatum]KAF6796898.1 hypothetical protein CTRU02_03876 [Colletotrichum truncatum]